MHKTFMHKVDFHARKHLPYTASQQLTFTPESQAMFQYEPIGTMLKSALEVPEVLTMVFILVQ